MIMSWIYSVIIAISIVASFVLGNGAELAASLQKGAQNGINLAISISGSICLWTGIAKLLEAIGAMEALARLLKPILKRIFPSAEKDSALRGALSANICANILGLGNAATPMGIRAAERLATVQKNRIASDELCRLVVLNTASIQLFPANVAALRTSLGCASPFDILPAVWITSICSAGLGLTAAWLMGKVWRHD